MQTNSLASDAELTRRQFLRRSGLAAAAFTVLPGAVLSMRGAASPNQKLNLAGIGVGGQGAHDLGQMESENIVAVCDVDKDRGRQTFRKHPKAKQFTDYRRMLDEMKEIDAVVVATPDHHHAFAAMEAIKRGKHVYCEKPLTHSPWEARQVAEAARKAKVATQMGNQGQASRETRQLCELVWAGAIGNVYEAHIWTDRPSRGLFEEYWPQGLARPKETPPVPATLDWDLWVGPAPFRPYHPVYVPFAWRGWWDFGTGALGDIGCHAMDPVFRALKLGAPLSVQAASTRVNTETFPLGSMVTWQFPGATSPPAGDQPPHSRASRALKRAALRCRHASWCGMTAACVRRGLTVCPKEARWGTTAACSSAKRDSFSATRCIPSRRPSRSGQVRKTLPRSVGHYQEWIEACKGGQPAGANFDWAGPLAESVLLGNVALRTQLREDLTLRKLLWDPVAFKFTNLADANAFLRRDYRAGWSL